MLNKKEKDRERTGEDKKNSSVRRKKKSGGMDWSPNRKKPGPPRRKMMAGEEIRPGQVKRKSLGVAIETKAGRTVPGKPEAGRTVLGKPGAGRKVPGKPEAGRKVPGKPKAGRKVLGKLEHTKRSAGVLLASQTGEGDLGRMKEVTRSPRHAILSRSLGNLPLKTAVPMLMTTRLKFAGLPGPKNEASNQRDLSPNPPLLKLPISLLTSSLAQATLLFQTISSLGQPKRLLLSFNSLQQLLHPLKSLPQTSQQRHSQPGKQQRRNGDSPTQWPL